MSDGLAGDALAPDPDHLLDWMAGATRERDAWRAMGERAARHVHRCYAWMAVTDRLVESLFAGA